MWLIIRFGQDQNSDDEGNGSCGSMSELSCRACDHAAYPMPPSPMTKSDFPRMSGVKTCSRCAGRWCHISSERRALSASYDMIVNSRAFSTRASLLLTSRTFDGRQFNGMTSSIGRASFCSIY
jgi:hypothetical protein